MSLFQNIVDRIRAIAHGVKEFVKDVAYDVDMKFGKFDPVEFEKNMDERAADYEKLEGQKLDWRHSIVDLLKAIGLDSSLDARRELNKEFHLFSEYTGTADENIALHNRVLDGLADNDIRLPRAGRPVGEQVAR